VNPWVRGACRSPLPLEGIWDKICCPEREGQLMLHRGPLITSVSPVARDDLLLPAGASMPADLDLAPALVQKGDSDLDCP
jgi:hypothetical protein